MHKLEQLRKSVDQALRQAIPISVGVPPVIRDAMCYAVFSGGKRFRLLLCLGACQAVGGHARQAISVACAVELIHSYSLVHDDLPAMDNANERRGKPSCHRKFGEANAILAGDALLTLAFERLSRNGIHRRRSGLRPARPHGPTLAGAGAGGSRERRVVPIRRTGERSRMDGASSALGIIRIIGQASGTIGLIGGQALDVQRLSRPHTLTARRLTRIAQQKTAALITASVVSGAMAGGASPIELRHLTRYGRAIGLAFQLVDDVHDKEGLARILGTQEASVRAQRLIANGLGALKPFGKCADTLRQLAGWLASS